ncbi:MAG: sensor histidine kinase, partial [Sphingobacteriaceae bacterium]
TIQDIRSVSHNLLPIDLKKGLTIALEELVDQINFTSVLTKIEMTITSEFKALALSQQTTLYIYRIVQEIINNSLKYAQAKNIHINMDYKKNQILLLLSDDGIGFNINDTIKSEGIGLKNIKNRVEQLKGTIEIGSSQNKGTIFTIRIPQ